MTEAPLILAVVVLYRQRADESTSLTALRHMRASSPQLDMMLWDNTPDERVKPADFDGVYVHDGSNPGLAAAYNAALQLATERGARWLMLLDQDTFVSDEYLQEVMQLASIIDADAMVPRLISRGAVTSPFYPTPVGPMKPIEAGLHGLATKPLQAFNSGSVFSVAVLNAVGGFDCDFPLDYLDHATFATLQAKGGQVYVLHAALQHELASDTGNALDAGTLRRQQDVLEAEQRFYCKYGTEKERSATKKRLLQRAASVLVHKRDVRHAWLILKTLRGTGI